MMTRVFVFLALLVLCACAVSAQKGGICRLFPNTPGCKSSNGDDVEVEQVVEQQKDDDDKKDDDDNDIENWLMDAWRLSILVVAGCALWWIALLSRDDRSLQFASLSVAELRAARQRGFVGKELVRLNQLAIGFAERESIDVEVRQQLGECIGSVQGAVRVAEQLDGDDLTHLDVRNDLPRLKQLTGQLSSTHVLADIVDKLARSAALRVSSDTQLEQIGQRRVVASSSEAETLQIECGASSSDALASTVPAIASSVEYEQVEAEAEPAATLRSRPPRNKAWRRESAPSAMIAGAIVHSTERKSLDRRLLIQTQLQRDENDQLVRLKELQLEQDKWATRCAELRRQEREHRQLRTRRFIVLGYCWLYALAFALVHIAQLVNSPAWCVVDLSSLRHRLVAPFVGNTPPFKSVWAMLSDPRGALSYAMSLALPTTQLGCITWRTRLGVTLSLWTTAALVQCIASAPHFVRIATVLLAALLGTVPMYVIGASSLALMFAYGYVQIVEQASEHWPRRVVLVARLSPLVPLLWFATWIL
jgi:hypothetical protein